MGAANSSEKRRSASGSTCVAILALALSACRLGTNDSSPGPSERAAPNAVRGPDTRAHPIGELGRARDYVMSVDSVKDCPNGELGSAKKALASMGVEVDIQGTTALEVPANAFYATARDASGDHYAATLTGCEPPLPAVRVTHGHGAHGFITFDVPKLSRTIEVRYAPPVIGVGTEELRFSIPR